MTDMQATLDSTRKMAADALDRASASMKDLRSGVSERAGAAQRYVGDYARTGTRYVTENPLKSALIAAAVGAAVAGLIIALRNREDRDTWF
ncbi:hypothetical protein [Ramlibacter alkalitolerans]|jgi:ElaB/YqjD/DUF883 family membrane-anchored ribosome-binding protein|uniref:DUF883 domain-containing protein n=1 Tax=Ramlibacter alkalitolerans TaxID=2039631 RepID=A0ABS1JPY7_9BURK|nr:hypothetical protein [Ramlibacter alkalitolerans]MBL0426322.1 hypothetical protein [Ramlibacter alkalitolerans]